MRDAHCQLSECGHWLHIWLSKGEEAALVAVTLALCAAVFLGAWLSDRRDAAKGKK